MSKESPIFYILIYSTIFDGRQNNISIRRYGRKIIILHRKFFPAH